jgi:hypothetical protein
MNRVVNIFIMIVLTAFTFITLVIIFDLAISNIHLKAMPYKYEVLTGLSVLVFLLGILRMKARWQGIKDMRSFSQFDYVSNVSKAFLNRSRTYTLLEILFMSGALILFLRFAQLDFNLMISMIIVLAFLILEGLIFLVLLSKKGKGFRVGINNQVIAYFAREMKLFYYEGLQRVELHQSDLISFKYRDDLVLFMPTSVLDKEDIPKFKAALIEQLDNKNIYFDDRFRNWE